MHHYEYISRAVIADIAAIVDPLVLRTATVLQMIGSRHANGFCCSIFLSALFLCNAAVADDSYRKQSGNRTVMSGIRTKIGQHYHINNDCTAAPMPPAVIIKSPANGKIEIVKEKIFPKSSGPLARCGSVKVSGLAAYYTSKSGFTGKDQFTIRTPVGDGKISDTTITVTVLK